MTARSKQQASIVSGRILLTVTFVLFLLQLNIHSFSFCFSTLLSLLVGDVVYRHNNEKERRSPLSHLFATRILRVEKDMRILEIRKSIRRPLPYPSSSSSLRSKSNPALERDFCVLLCPVLSFVLPFPFFSLYFFFFENDSSTLTHERRSVRQQPKIPP